jgi:lipopolysaccharide biosynthesis regulator YciM
MKYELCTGVTIEKIGEQSVLMTEKGDAAGLNESAESILSYLLDGVDDASAAQKLVDVYDVDSNTLIKDIEKFISELMEKGLIRPLT